MASMAELQDALVNADKAGDTEAARQLADAIHSMRSVQELKPASVKAGESMSGIPRQLGLTARYALEGPAQLAQIATEPLRLLTDKLTGTKNSRPLSAVASQFADTLGLPSPQGADERVVGDAARLVSGGLGAGAAGRLAQGLGGAAGQVGGFFSPSLEIQGWCHQEQGLGFERAAGVRGGRAGAGPAAARAARL